MKKETAYTLVSVTAIVVFFVCRLWPAGKVSLLKQTELSVHKGIPIGASQQQVRSYFNKHKILFDFIPNKDGRLEDESFVDASKIPLPKLSGVYTGEIPSKGGVFDRDCRINLMFFMDRRNRVIKYTVGELCASF